MISDPRGKFPQKLLIKFIINTDRCSPVATRSDWKATTSTSKAVKSMEFIVGTYEELLLGYKLQENNEVTKIVIRK